MKKLLAALCFIALLAMAQAQVITTSANPRAVVPTADSYLIGGKLVLTLDKPWTAYVPVILSITLDNPALKWDTSRPPIAYRNDWERNLLTVTATEREILVRVDSAAYAGEFNLVQIRGFVLDVLDAGLQPGNKITVHLAATGDEWTFSNSTVDLLRVGSAARR